MVLFLAHGAATWGRNDAILERGVSISLVIQDEVSFHFVFYFHPSLESALAMVFSVFQDTCQSSSSLSLQLLSMPLGLLSQIGLHVVLPYFLSKVLYGRFPRPTSWTSVLPALNSFQTLLTALMTSVHCRQGILIGFLCWKHFHLCSPVQIFLY